MESMTPEEIDYFRLYAGSHPNIRSGDMAHLFEALVTEMNDPSGHMERIEADQRVANELYRMLLRSLRFYLDGANIGVVLRSKMEEYRLLIDRCLYDQADRTIADARELAKRFEFFYELIQIINLQKTQLHRISDLKTASEVRAQLEQDEQEAWKLLENYRAFRSISKEISELYRHPEKHGKDSKLEKLSDLFASDLLRQEEAALSQSAHYYFYHERATYFYYIGDVRKAYGENEKLIKLLQRSPFLVDLSLPGFVVTYFNNLVFNLELEHWAEFEKRLNEFENIPDSMSKFDTLRYRKYIFERARFLELKKLLFLGKFQEGIDSIPAIEAGIDLYGDKLDPYFKAQFWYVFAYFYFLQEDYEGCRHWLNRLLTISGFREDVTAEALMFSRVLDYEMGWHEAFRKALPDTKNFLKKTDRLLETHLSVLDGLETAIQAGSDLEKCNALEQVRRKIDESESNPDTKMHVGYFDYTSWLQSKLEKRPFSEVFAAREATSKFRVIR